MRRKIIALIEYLIIFVILFYFGLRVNNGINIKGLYMDDLFNWSWFPGLNIFDYAFKFYGASRYRPFFDALQYIEYFIVQNNVWLFVYINIFLNVLVALFVYHFAKRLNAKRVIALIVAILYIVSHFSYYQIGQVLGLIETEAQFFALIILYLCLKLTGVIKTKKEIDFIRNTNTYKVDGLNISDKDIMMDIRSFEESNQKFLIRTNIVLLIGIFLMFFVIAFTHERYLCLAPLIVFSIIFAKKRKRDIEGKALINYKYAAIIFFICELALIALIRYLAIGKIVPAGTGGTYVEDTFSFSETLSNCFKQIAFIFGINIGPDYLVGINFFDIENNTAKLGGLISIILILFIVSIYLIKKINSEKKTGEKPSFVPDLLFLTFIAFCIGGSSVTIRVEMRFIFVSFTASFLYLSYMCGYIFHLMSFTDTKIRNIMLFIFIHIFMIAIFLGRGMLELKYRSYYKNIYFFTDLDRVNSLYDNTIGRYGVDEVLHNKKIYMVNQNFGFTEFYARWFFKIYDKNVFKPGVNEENIKKMGNEIILLNDISELPESANKDNSIVLLENLETFRTYKTYNFD